MLPCKVQPGECSQPPWRQPPPQPEPRQPPLPVPQLRQPPPPPPVPSEAVAKRSCEQGPVVVEAQVKLASTRVELSSRRAVIFSTCPHSSRKTASQDATLASATTSPSLASRSWLVDAKEQESRVRSADQRLLASEGEVVVEASIASCDAFAFEKVLRSTVVVGVVVVLLVSGGGWR